ncbi:MAG: hypothetical protein QW775_00290 [Ignisphaera sp.]|uniref:UPF0282 protein ENU08_04895 n=1 Tax=Ignisphaera aggregans TaxID=334771 RepID=A0A7C4NLV1_9CREN
MDIKFVAFESMGVRSQASFIQTKSANVFIDPSAALAPRRFGLPPHLIEAERLLDVFNKIEELIKDSDLIIYTHYHYDHHDPGRFIDIELYRGKAVYVKDPGQFINLSQKIRASKFLKILNEKARIIYVADRRSVSINNVMIRFSNPLPHGEGNRLGYVVAVCISDADDGFMYTSDIEGGPREDHRVLLSFCDARIAVVDGPPTYLLGYRYSEESLRHSISFLSELLEINSLDILVLDHHSCRDLNYTEKFADLMEKAKNLGKHVKTAAEAMGLSPLFLEAKRRELYKEKPENGLKLLMSKYKGFEGKELGNIFGED